MTANRTALEAALAKPIAESFDFQSCDDFDPWDDIMHGIHGSYSSESDDLAVAALLAVRDRKTFDFVQAHGFAAEFMLYCFSGFGLLNYGTSPRGGWPDEEIADLWQPLIDKWTAYADVTWAACGWRERVPPA